MQAEQSPAVSRVKDGGVDGKIGRAEGGGKELDMKMDCRMEG